MRKWTTKEEATIITWAMLYPNNLRHSFEIVSKKIGRTPSAICTRFYNKLQKLELPMYIDFSGK